MKQGRDRANDAQEDCRLDEDAGMWMGVCVVVRALCVACHCAAHEADGECTHTGMTTREKRVSPFTKFNNPAPGNFIYLQTILYMYNTAIEFDVDKEDDFGDAINLPDTFINYSELDKTSKG